MTRFEGKVVLVTGGRSGIGRAIARRLESEGARLFTAQRGSDENHEAIRVDFADPDAPAAGESENCRRPELVTCFVCGRDHTQQKSHTKKSLAVIFVCGHDH